MEGEFWWLAWDDNPERTPATASGAHAPTHRPPRLSRNAAPAPPSGVESDPPSPYDFVQQAASEHGEPPPYESRLHLPPSPNQPNSSAAASTPAGSSRASTRRVPSGSDQRDRAPATSNVTSQGPSPPAPVPIAYRFSGTFSRLGLGQRNTGAHTSTYTPTPNPAQQQRAVQTMNALCISGVIGVPEMATAYLDSQSARLE